MPPRRNSPTPRRPPHAAPASRPAGAGAARARRALLRLAIAIAVALGLAAAAGAHDVPADVRIQAFVRPAGDRLQLLVRVPLAAMTDIDFPRRGPGYLDLARLDAALRDAATLGLADSVDVYEGDTRLAAPRVAAVRVSLPSDRSFASWPEALAHATGPALPVALDLVWNQQHLDALLEYAIASDRSAFSIHPRFARLGLDVRTTLQFLPPGGAARVFELRADPGRVALDPRWFQAASRFVELGFFHILDGGDHLLFLLCLVLPLRRLRPLVVVVTAFTVAHSVTLIASALGFAPGAPWFPPLIEVLIAASIVGMALGNIVGGGLERRWLIAFAFGLVHGFGFAFALRETLQLAGTHVVTALFAFNLGVELGQLLVVALLVAALGLALRAVPARMGIIVVSALVAHTAWHWTGERWDRLARFRPPPLDAAFGASALRWLAAAIVVGGALWLVDLALRRAGWQGGAAAPPELRVRPISAASPRRP